MSLTANYESANQQLSHSEKTASQYDRYMIGDYSKIVEQVRAERQVVDEIEHCKEIQQGRNIQKGNYGR